MIHFTLLTVSSEHMLEFDFNSKISLRFSIIIRCVYETENHIDSDNLQTFPFVSHNSHHRLYIENGMTRQCKAAMIHRILANEA